MKRAMLPILFALIIAVVPAAAFAAINVSLSDGVTTVQNTTALPGATSGFNLTRPAPLGGNHTLMLLGDCTASSQTGCTRTRFFPSGLATAQAGDTFKIQDISSSNRARIEKIDVPAGGTATTGADTLNLRGIKIFALAGGAGKTFTLTYETEAGDFTEISSSSGNYAATAKLKGQFRFDSTSPKDGNSGPVASTCGALPAGVTNPCLQLSLQINAISLNAAGSNSSTNITVSLPCSATADGPDADTNPDSPCGASGFWSPALALGDQFLASDSGSVGCGTTCNPVHKGTFKAKFSQADEVVTLSQSAGIGMAQDTPEGLIALAEQLDTGNVWLASCLAFQQYEAVAESPLGSSYRLNSNAKVQVKMHLLNAGLVPATGGYTMESIVDTPKEIAAGLPLTDQLRNNACSMVFVPSPRPTLKQIKDSGSFTLDWGQFVVGSVASTDPRFNNPTPTLNYSGCTACFRIEIELLSIDSRGTVTPAGKLKIYLGTDTSPKDIDASTPHPLNLISNSASRVDASEIAPDFKPQQCCITFAAAASNSNYGKLFVRAVTVRLDLGEDFEPAEHQVTSVTAVVGGSSSSSQLLVAGEPTPSVDWPPTNGLVLQIYKQQPDGSLLWVHTIVPPALVISSAGKVEAEIPMAALQIAGAGTGTYIVQLFAFSGAANFDLILTQEFIGGIPLPFPGFFMVN